MRKSGAFLSTLVIAFLGLCFGAADLALAGPNAKGCTTKLWIPAGGGTPGILCGKTPACPDPNCTSVGLGSGYWVCGCPSNPGGAPYMYITSSEANCVTFLHYNDLSVLEVVCMPGYCSSTCETTTTPVYGSGGLLQGTEKDCRCPGGT